MEEEPKPKEWGKDVENSPEAKEGTNPGKNFLVFKSWLNFYTNVAVEIEMDPFPNQEEGNSDWDRSAEERKWIMIDEWLIIVHSYTRIWCIFE